MHLTFKGLPGESGGSPLGVIDSVPDHSLKVLNRQTVFIFKVYTAFTGFYSGVLLLETLDVVIPAGIQGDVVFLVGNCNPSFPILIRRHPVLLLPTVQRLVDDKCRPVV
jgi:hypothetical protein